MKFNIGVGFLSTFSTLAIDVGRLPKTSALTASSSGHSKITCWTVRGASLHHLHRGRGLWISLSKRKERVARVRPSLSLFSTISSLVNLQLLL